MYLISPEIVVWAGWVTLAVFVLGIIARSLWPFLDQKTTIRDAQTSGLRGTVHALAHLAHRDQPGTQLPLL